MNEKVVKKAVKKPISRKKEKLIKKPKLEKVKIKKYPNLGKYVVIIISILILVFFIFLAYLSSIKKEAYTEDIIFDLDRDYRDNLVDGENVTPELQKAFEENNKNLTNKSKIEKKGENSWIIKAGTKKYLIKDNGTRLNVINPHKKIEVSKYHLESEIKVGTLDIKIMWVDYLTFGILGFFGPIGFYFHSKEKKLDKIEDKYPDFLRDLAEFWRGGLSMTTAVDTLSQGEYGALDDEVQKMATQLSWGVAFTDVLNMFKERVKSKLIDRSVSLVDQANRAGGKISDILLTAANDAREIKLLEKERKANIGHYTAVIYVSFGVYLAVIIVLAYVFLPEIATTSEELKGGIEYIKGLDISVITGLFFFSVMIQALGNGMLAGLMGRASPSAGAKHGFIMLSLTWLIFKVFGIEVGI